ncbi:MAG: GNAT family N-acetyltransferase [candidate division Zixibacteria bacterium]|nr:GNAT family N-acetyltransferase [candidate division Zixibacteria bacterium]
MDGRNLKIRLISDIDSFISFEESWNNFLEQCVNNDFFLSYNWFKTFFSTQRFSGNLRILVFEEGGRILGAAPLVKDRGTIRTPGGWKIPISANKIHFIADDLAPRCDFPVIDNPEPALTKIAEYLASISSEWEIIAFRQIPDSSPNLPVLKRIFDRFNLDTIITDDSICPYRVFNHSDPQSKSQMIYPSSARQERLINKGLRELKKKGKVEIKTSRNGDLSILESHIAEIEYESWKRKQKRRLFSNDMAEFTSMLMKSAAVSDQLFVILLYFNEIPIAYNLGFIYKNKYYSYSSAYKERFAHYKPGYILHREVVRIMDNMNLEEHDFLMGDSRYKRSFCNNVRQNHLIRVFNSHPASRTLFTIFRGIRPLYKQFKKSLFPARNGDSSKYL